MLDNLHVKDMALISEAEVEFGSGLNIMTGETGAGKSIILGSINLALGARAGADIIRSGKESALVELSFSLSQQEIEQVKALDLPVEEDGVVLLTRKILPTKSVFRMNGETITAGQLKNLSGILLNMYGQHEHQSLLKSSTYVNMLDEYAGEEIAVYRSELKDAIVKLNELEDILEDEVSDESIRNRQIEFLSYEVEEITAADLKVGEDEELENRYKFLSNARRIMETVTEVHRITGYDENSSAGNVIGYGVGRLNSVSNLDEDASKLWDELSQIENLLNDFNRSLSDYEEKLNFDEDEYAQIEERLNFINKLKLKYGNSIEDIMDALDSKNEEIQRLRDYENYLSGVRDKISSLKSNMLLNCKKISALRNKASGVLSDKIMEAMKALNFQEVRLKIDITSDESRIRESGYDDIEFMISLNAGEELKPMQNVASGGELSRIMLAIKSVFAEKDDVPTLIFDEIDTGISGVTAYKVAEQMKSLSDNHQIICITHLPQIAAMADHHYLIEKTVEDGRAKTDIYSLDEEKSVRELARMLGSDEISESAIINARELKDKGRR